MGLGGGTKSIGSDTIPFLVGIDIVRTWSQLAITKHSDFDDTKAKPSDKVLGPPATPYP